MDKLEGTFFQVISDISAYLENLTLVGGWVPFVYAKYLWQDTKVMPLTTSDIDIGVPRKLRGFPSKTIYETLLPKYGQHHISMDRMFPIVFHLQNVEIHFISTEDAKEQILERLVGKKIDVSKIEHFEILTENRIPVKICLAKHKTCNLYVPKPAAYLYHKGLTFTTRLYDEGKAKDLHYIYYVLRFCPRVEEIISELKKFKSDKNFKTFKANIDKYFERVSSEGCLMVEKENGRDVYIDNVREDAFTRFRSLIESL